MQTLWNSPFCTGLARVGFIAVEFLNSLVQQKIISSEDKQKLLLSLETITTSLSKDIRRLSKSKFLENYGHLRPGTYDIRSKRYLMKITILTLVIIPNLWKIQKIKASL